RDARAEQEFTQSIAHAKSRLEGKGHKSRNATEARFAHTCLGKNLGFGYGWLSSHRAEYRQARKYFEASSILLRGTTDRLLGAHLEILASSCRRKELGPKPIIENDVIPRLQAAFREVASNPKRPVHSRYASLAAYELGMAYFYLALLEDEHKP